ncbi:11539_t:CDS:2, partial [Rhizophagus irregularis]
DEMLEGGLTDEEIVDRKKLLWQLAVVKRFINESIRFLYTE